MIEFLKKYFKIILGIIFVLSLTGNILLIGWQGVHLHKKQIINNHNEQYQSQGQINIFNNMANGDKIAWEYHFFKKPVEVTRFLKSLHFSSYVFKSIVYNCEFEVYEVWVAHFLKKRKE